jgi:phage gp45-like
MTGLYPESSSITRGTLISVDDSGDWQKTSVRGFKGEEFSEVLRAQSHGVSSNPPAGSVGNFMRLGSSDRLFALGFETPGRPRDLPPGVVALYNADGNVMKLLPAKTDWDHGGKNHHARAIGKQKTEATDWVQFDAPAIYLGKPPYFPVMTTAGPSQHVFAGIAPSASPTPSGSI